MLEYLFPGIAAPHVLSCLDACDVDDNSELNPVDAVQLLEFLFANPVSPIASPYPDCGSDSTGVSDCSGEVMGC